MKSTTIKDLRMQNRFYYECVLADGKLFDLCEMWEELSPGDELFLARDTVNTSNPYAVVVLCKCSSEGGYKIIGHLPKTEKSEDIANILDLNWDDNGEFFSCRLVHKEFKDSEFQVQLSIRIKRKA